MNKSLLAIFAEDRFPHQAAIALGSGQSLKIRFRALGDAQKAAQEIFLKERLTELGLDAEVAFRSLRGQLPDGEELAAFEAAIEALGETAAKQIESVAALSRGYGLSLVVGSLSLLEGKDEHPVDEAITAETMAALPEDVKKAIEALAVSVQAPAKALDFLGQSPRF